MGRLYRLVGPTETRFLYDGNDVIAEYDSSNVLQNRYVHGDGPDEPLVWYVGSGTTDRRWLVADNQGSIVGAANATGVLMSQGGTPLINTYDEYGVPGSANFGRFQYIASTPLAPCRNGGKRRVDTGWKPERARR